MASSSQALHVKDNFNAEDAAYAAQEFVSSLDNLPGEVTFLLEEIREKDARINQLLSRINTRHFGLTKHARNNINSARDKESSTAPGQTTPPFPLPLPTGAALPTGHLSTKDAQALTKIIAEFAKVEVLQQEKIVLAERMERIVGRAKERGRAEWLKVGGMDLEEVAATRRADEERNGREGGMGGGGVVLPSMGLGGGDRRKWFGKAPDIMFIANVPEKKSHALPLPPSFPISGHTIHPPPNTSMPPPPAPRGPGRRRADRHQSTTASLFSEPDPEASGEYDPAFDPDADGEADADGEVDAEGEMEYDEGDAEEASETDNSIYCSCRQKSYGEMIGCDNDDCPIEWYHLKCVGIQGAPPDKWYCPTCVINLGLSGPSGRISGREKKGRKGRQ